MSAEFEPLESSVSRGPNYRPKRPQLQEALGNFAVTRSNTILVYFVPELAMYNHIFRRRIFEEPRRLFAHHRLYPEISASLVALRYPSLQNLSVVRPEILEDFYRQSLEQDRFSDAVIEELWDGPSD